MKKNQGITLVALVITIILLLILAGITISQLTGSGLFENARLAKEKSDNAQEKEDETLADYENKIGEYVDGSRDTGTGEWKCITVNTAYSSSNNLELQYDELKNANDIIFEMIATYSDETHTYIVEFNNLNILKTFNVEEGYVSQAFEYDNKTDSYDLYLNVNLHRNGLFSTYWSAGSNYWYKNPILANIYYR